MSISPKTLPDNNIGTLRFIGAFMVLFGHSFNLSDSNGPVDPFSRLIMGYMPWGQPLQTLGVILFFGISGYLVTQSYLNKNDMFEYLLARCMRIYPALIMAVLFCVFVVGLLHTTLSVIEYLRHPMTKQYLWINSTLISIRFALPGVFEGLPAKMSVNGSLWTLPVEFRLYLMVAMLGVLRVLARQWLFNLAGLFLIAGFLYWPEWVPALLNPKIPYLFLSFVLGMYFCINKQSIVLTFRILIVLLILCVIVWQWFSSWIYDYLALITFISIVMYVGFYCPFRMPRLDKHGDFSYGLYLYAFPIQQTLVGVLGPGQPWRVFLLAFICTLLMAVFSWHYIEKPALLLVKRLTG